MGLLDFILRRKPEAAPVKQKNTEPGVFIAPAFPASIPPVPKSTDYLDATATGWVYACASVISEAIAKTNFRLYQLKDGKPVEIPKHPLLDLIYKVNQFTTSYDHFYRTQMFLEGTGEAPWYLSRGTRKQPTSMILLRPDRLEIKFDEKQIIGGYKYRQENGSYIDIAPEDIIFLRNPSMTSEFRGMGTLQAAATVVDTEDFTEKYKRNFFYNSARPDFVLETEAKLPQTTIDRMKKLWESLFQGVDNAHKMAILDSGLKANVLGWSQQDMQLVESMRWDRDKIMAIFRVGKSILGITEDVNLASAQAAESNFIKFTIKPRLERLVQQLNEFLCPQFGDNLYFDYDDPTPDNLTDKGTFYRNALDGGWMTTNEVRAEEGLAPLTGGDTILKPIGLVPAMSLPTPPTVKSKENRRFRISQQWKTTKEEQNKEKKQAVAKAIAPLIKEIMKKDIKRTNKKIKKTKANKAPKSLFDTTEKRDTFQQFLNVKSVAKFEELIKTRMQQAFGKQQQMVEQGLKDQKFIKDFSAEAKRTAEQIVEELWDSDREELERIVNDGVYPAINELIKEQALATAGYIGVTAEDITGDPKTAEAIRATTLKLSGEVNKVTRDSILGAIAEGVDAGEGITQITERVQQVFADASTSRAETIARSEAIRGSNFAAEEVYRQAGIKTKEWITASDERTCPFCDSMDGKQIEVGKDFWDKGDSLDVDGQSLSFDYLAVGGPPLHPNCRCTLGPVIET